MKVTIQVKANSLPNVAGAFKGVSDPFAVISLLTNTRDAKASILGKTEVLKNTLNPNWTKTFTIDYELGTTTNVLIKIFDEVRKGENIVMGSAVFDISAVLGAKGNTKKKALKKGGMVVVRAQKAAKEETFKFKMSGSKLKNMDGMFGTSDPFYEFIKKNQGHRGTEWNTVHRSPHIKNNLNPQWAEEILDLGVLCNNDMSQMLSLNVFDHESSGKHELIGKAETSINDLIAAAKTQGPIVLKNKGKPTGSLVVHVAEVNGKDTKNDIFIEEQMNEITVSPSAPPLLPTSDTRLLRPSKTAKPTFEDYISGGCEINLSIAIDFTGSNGDPRDAGSLHYFNPDGSPNDYEKAISAIGTVLSKFDNDQKFPVLGFGAKVNGTVQHCFQCGPEKEVRGVKGIIDAYRNVFRSGLTMSGPTVITEVLQTAAVCAASSQEHVVKEGKQKYSILLILTDGVVSDVSATLQAIESINQVPLSVVIVGIGNADFSGMQFLDDNGCGPDIIQFVEFNSHRHSSMSLTNATLDEIPDQLVDYFVRNGIKPNPPVHIDEQDIQVEAENSEEEEIDVTIDFGDNGKTSISSGGMYIPPGIY